jgi:hypothetical protein
MSELPPWAGAEMIRMADEEFVASMEPLDLTEFKDAEIARLQHQWSESDKAWLAAKQEIARLREAGVGYSQQTVDAITKEREQLRAENERLRDALIQVIQIGGGAVASEEARVAEQALRGDISEQ